MHRSFAARLAAGLLVGLTALSLAACTGIAAAPTAAPSTVPTAAPTPAPTPTPMPLDVKVAEPDNGKTVKVPVGSTITVVLASTYWQVQGSSDAKVLAATAGPTVSAPPMGACVPGSGCGTVTMVFHAVAPGSASIIAGRQVCGEAMQCAGTAGAYQVTIVVGG